MHRPAALRFEFLHGPSIVEDDPIFDRDGKPLSGCQGSAVVKSPSRLIHLDLESNFPAPCHEVHAAGFFKLDLYLDPTQVRALIGLLERVPATVAELQRQESAAASLQ